MFECVGTVTGVCGANMEKSGCQWKMSEGIGLCMGGEWLLNGVRRMGRDPGRKGGTSEGVR